MNDPTPEFLMRNARVFMKKERRGVERRRMSYKNKKYIYAHVVWNFLNPNDKVKKGDVIHHIDGDTLNDFPDNLQKMTRGEHTHHHNDSMSNETKEKLSLTAKEQWSRKTHCKRGHPLSGDNLFPYIKKEANGRSHEARGCKACRNESTRRWKAKRKLMGGIGHDAS